MRKLILKSGLYFVFILIALEVIVRIFHLSKDNPSRYVDEFNVEKWVPNQEGYSVTGNRRQNFSKFYINQSGYNSYREFVPSEDKVELALVGDSFIEGFHQNYYNSIGKKIENKIPDIEVYEYGYAGYDLADQLHLICAYKDTFDKIDHVVLGLKFGNDLTRNEYRVVTDRLHLESTLYRTIRKSKLIVYSQNIGILEPLWVLAGKLSSIGKTKKQPVKSNVETDEATLNLTYINNFESLVSTYGFDKTRFVFLIDTSITPSIFMNHLESKGYQYIDVHYALSVSKKPTTLIYDRHWNNHGREIIAKIVSEFIINKRQHSNNE